MIKVFSKPNCVPCANLKTWLKVKKLDYEEVPIEEHMQKFIDMGFMGAPVVQVGDTYVAGANIGNVAEAIQRQTVSV